VSKGESHTAAAAAAHYTLSCSLSIPPLTITRAFSSFEIQKTNFHTYTKQQVTFLDIADGKANHTKLQCSKHSLNFTCSLFLCQFNANFLVLVFVFTDNSRIYYW
jgi:hypothetical protein